ncbi:hypothetical protein BH11PSE7_BH11PSE7_24940 [soil metagenome]
MKRIIMLLAAVGAMSGVLAGCVAYVPDYGPQHRQYRGDRDRDHDGVPNKYDARPNNPNRY